MTELFSIKDLSIRRDDVRVLDRINWTMQRGEHWVILGGNGSGKTSLLKALTGYMPPTDGTIILLGEEFGESDWRELRRHVGVVSASISHLCHEEDLALEIVAGGKHAMIGYWGRISAAEQKRARRLLGLLGVGYASSRRWEVLSQGERQRVLIARALMADPAILILDEPCSGLDPVAREHFLRDLSKLASQASAPGLVLVTHHVEEILPEFTHLLALKNGKALYNGALAKGLTSSTLSDIFQAKLTVRKQAGRYRLSGIS
jgi:iron complex transport system ATP-binding protein